MSSDQPNGDKLCTLVRSGDTLCTLVQSGDTLCTLVPSSSHAMLTQRPLQANLLAANHANLRLHQRRLTLHLLHSSHRRRRRRRVTATDEA